MADTTRTERQNHSVVLDKAATSMFDDITVTGERRHVRRKRSEHVPLRSREGAQHDSPGAASMSCVLQVPTTIAPDGHAAEGCSCCTLVDQTTGPRRMHTNGSKHTNTLPASDPPHHHYQVLPASDLTPRQCFQQSNDTKGATIVHGFHRETRT